MRRWGAPAEQAFADIKDAIRYTLQYPDDQLHRRRYRRLPAA